MHWLDPDYLPATKGIVKQFLLNPHGDADGFILMDGTEVHFPPHMSNEMRAAVAPGDEVTIRGAKPRYAEMIAAVAVDTAGGRRIDDKGPPDDDDEDHHGKDHRKPKHEQMQIEGVVVRALHGPKGEVRGALLEDGTTLRFPKDRADGVATLITPEASLAVRGKGLKTEIGIVIDAKEMGTSSDDLKPLKHNPKHGKHDHNHNHGK